MRNLVGSTNLIVGFGNYREGKVWTEAGRDELGNQLLTGPTSGAQNVGLSNRQFGATFKDRQGGSEAVGNDLAGKSINGRVIMGRSHDCRHHVIAFPPDRIHCPEP